MILQERFVYVPEKEEKPFGLREDSKMMEMTGLHLQGMENGFSTTASEERWFSAIKPVKLARPLKVIEFDYSLNMLHKYYYNFYVIYKYYYIIYIV